MAGVASGMRATKGAIEDIWINDANLEPTFRVIGKVKPRGICGSGLIALLGEMFLTGVIDKAGNFNDSRKTPRIRQGEHGWEYVICYADDSSDGNDIVITHVDVDNLLRAKAAIYAVGAGAAAGLALGALNRAKRDKAVAEHVKTTIDDLEKGD